MIVGILSHAIEIEYWANGNVLRGVITSKLKNRIDGWVATNGKEVRIAPPANRTRSGSGQAKLDILIEGFMRADWTAYRDATAWLRDFTDQKNIERGRAMFGGKWRKPLRPGSSSK